MCVLSQERDCRHHIRPQSVTRVEMNSNDKQLKFQRIKPSAGIGSIETCFVFSKVIEVERLPVKMHISIFVILGDGSSATSPRITYAIEPRSES